MGEPCEHLVQVVSYLRLLGAESNEDSTHPGNTLTLRYETTIDVGEIERRFALPACVMAWQMRNPHWPLSQGLRCTAHDQVLVWALPK